MTGPAVVVDACARAVAEHDIEAVLWMSWLMGLGGIVIMLLACGGLLLGAVLGERRK